MSRSFSFVALVFVTLTIIATNTAFANAKWGLTGKSKEFYACEIGDNLFAYMQGKSFKADCPVPRADLRYLHVLHIGFDGKIHEGEIVCHKAIASDLLEIFRELYKAKYQIERITLVDDYGADDETSMRANNTSSFNFRFISGTKRISKHGKGLAIDINPLQNPCVSKRNGGQLLIEPETAKAYTDRTKNFSHKIDHNDLCFKIFKAHGYEWGGDWKSLKDYQHFELPTEAIEKLHLAY